MDSSPPVADQPVQPAESRYAERKGEVGRCTKCGKKGLPEDAGECPRCLKRRRKWMRALRQERRANGLCACCGAKSDWYRCAACMIKQDRTPEQQKAKTEGEQDAWRKDGDGWERYRGKGRRGAPPAIVTDDQDLKMAQATLERGHEAMLYAHSPEVKERGRIERKGAMKAATSLLALCSRILDDIVDRNDVGEV